MLHIGDWSETFPQDTQVRVEAQVDFVVLEIDDNGEVVQMVGRSQDREWRCVVRRECNLEFVVGEYMHSTVDARPVKGVAENVSEIPVELDLVSEPLSLQDSIKAFCAQMIQHEFGRDSAEVDTFEDMMDFDIPDDDDWQYEAKEVIEEEPPAVTEPEPQPEPEEPPAETTT